MLSQAIQLIQQAALGLPPGTPLHKDALNSAQRLSRHLGQGFAGPALGTQKTMLGDMLRRTVQNAMMQRIMSMQGMGQPGPGGPPGGGGPPPPPNPATPLPGA